CIQLQSQLIDGSSCGYGGTCESGACKAGSLLDTTKAWYTQNLQIAVPVTVVVAIIILLMIWALYMCIRRRCVRKKASIEPAFAGRRGTRIPSWQPPPPPMDVVAPTVPVATRPLMDRSPMVAANLGSRRASIPSSLRPGGSSSKPIPSAYAIRTSNPPISPRNQSWDGVYGQPTSGSARMPGRGRPGSGQSGASSRAREPAFPAAGRNSNSHQSGRRDQSNWVDPATWNGPL
ncbi:hypothetical protein M0805_001287, partial [Coniferiporia weirii]